MNKIHMIYVSPEIMNNPYTNRQENCFASLNDEWTKWTCPFEHIILTECKIWAPKNVPSSKKRRKKYIS